MMMPTGPYVRAAFADLVPDPWDWPTFRAAVEHSRGRRLLLAPADLPSGNASLRLAMSDADLIVYSHAADQAQQLHAVGHQVGHMFLGHRALASDGGHRLFPHLDPAMASMVLTISRFIQADELAADELAALVVARALPRLELGELPSHDIS